MEPWGDRSEVEAVRTDAPERLQCSPGGYVSLRRRTCWGKSPGAMVHGTLLRSLHTFLKLFGSRNS